MVKKLWFILIVLLLVISYVTALTFDTDINIKAEPNQKLLIRLKDVNNGAIFDTLSAKIDFSGIGKANFSTSRSEVNLLILFIESGEVIRTEEKGPFVSGTSIDLDFRTNIPIEETENKTETINQTNITEEQNITQEQQETNKTSGITGFATSIGNNFKANYLYYIIGIIVITGVIVFFVLKKDKLKKSKAANSKIFFKPKLTDDDEERELADAEQRIKEAQEEITKIKQKKVRIKEYEQRLRQDQEILKQLKEED